VPFVDALEHRVRFEQYGDGDPVVLLGAVALDGCTWSAQIDGLGAACSILVLDLPVAGEAAGDGAASTALYADIAAFLLRDLGTGPVHVVGADLGGAVAQQLALRHPELVRSLALHGSWGRADNHLSAILRGWQVAARALSRRELARQTWPFLFTVWWFNDRPDEQAELERELEAAAQACSAGEFCRRIDACLSHDVLERLGEIKAPTLITVGDRDVLTPAHHAYSMRERMPSARVRVWQKMGHAPYREIPEAFNRVTLDWIREH
jgi:pimeloyl-ACP methyl ester carboxylesterase